jgi:hypothetical protein
MLAFMPFFMDRHEFTGLTATDAANMHLKDMELQDTFNVQLLTYWFDYDRQTAFCLANAPSGDAVRALHGASHGAIPNQVMSILGRRPAGARLHSMLTDGCMEAVDAAAKAVKKGLVVVRSSRVPTGTVGRNVEVQDDKLGFIASDELNPQKARILLSLALLSKRTPEEIQKLFYEY